jgi:signal transduction histidine kinase
MQAPFTPLSGIARYRRQSPSEPRIRVKGIVTYQRPGEDIFLHDETGGLQVRCQETNIFSRGETVEAMGFPVMEHSFPVLQDATLTRTKESQEPVVDRTATVPGTFKGFHHGDLIALKGKLLDRSLSPLRPGKSSSRTTGQYILTLQNSNYLFSAVALATPQFAGLASLPIGSTIEVSGICLLQADEAGVVEVVQLLLPDAASVRLLQRPSWWTAERLLNGLGVLLAMSFLGTIWAIMILRKNSALKLSIAEKRAAQEELQNAHDQLEWRVQERTRELNFEMSARKEAEVRVEAITAERTRIAQELHDTLLQGFTSIGLKLDTLTSTLPVSLAETKQKFQKILDQSDEYLIEARRAVYELRSPSLEKHADFYTALRKVSERALQSTGIQLNFSAAGTPHNLEHHIEGNLLRICEEAVANAVKHARPTQVEVNLEYSAMGLELRIRDNGCGFNPKAPNGAKAGHFGLIGIRERTKSIAGNMSLDSRPGHGTQIIVRLPEPANHG